jgi:hypothetical protein
MKELRVSSERWCIHYNTIRPHSSLGYKPPAPEARLTNSKGHGEVETAMRFPLLHTPDGGYLTSAYLRYTNNLPGPIYRAGQSASHGSARMSSWK